MNGILQLMIIFFFFLASRQSGSQTNQESRALCSVAQTNGMGWVCSLIPLIMTTSATTPMLWLWSMTVPKSMIMNSKYINSAPFVGVIDIYFLVVQVYKRTALAWEIS